MRDVLIIGAGPAGLSAAAYALRKRLDCMVLSKNFGGKAVYKQKFPDTDDTAVVRGSDLITDFKNELEYLDFAYKKTEVSGLDQSPEGFIAKTANGEEFQAKSLILASGIDYDKLGVPGEAEFFGKGIGSSSLSYSHLFYGKTVFVTGNGMRTIEAAAELKMQVEKLVLHMEEVSEDCFSDLNCLKEEENVQIIQGGKIERFSGEKYAEKVQIRDKRGNFTEIPADAFFIERECRGNIDYVKHLIGHTEADRVTIDTRNRSSVSGIFAAGDLTAVYAEQILIAVGEGIKAALSCYEYLRNM